MHTEAMGPHSGRTSLFMSQWKMSCIGPGVVTDVTSVAKTEMHVKISAYRLSL